MKKSIVALLCASALTAFATPPGNNGGGHGGCGVGQQTNGCGGTPIPGPQGPKGDPGAPGVKGDPGAPGRDGKDGKDGVGIAGAAGRDGRDGIDGKDGKDGQNAAPVKGDKGERGEKGEGTDPFVTAAQLNAARQEMDAIGKNAYAGTAGAIAIGSIPQAPDPGTKVIGAGAGYFRNEGALAVGLSHRSESGRWITKASASVDTRGAVGLGIGAAYTWK